MLTDFGIWLFVDMLLSVLNQCSSVAKFLWLRPSALRESALIVLRFAALRIKQAIWHRGWSAFHVSGARQERISAQPR